MDACLIEKIEKMEEKSAVLLQPNHSRSFLIQDPNMKCIH